jgi:hypothetical protein
MDLLDQFFLLPQFSPALSGSMDSSLVAAESRSRWSERTERDSKLFHSFWNGGRALDDLCPN